MKKKTVFLLFLAAFIISASGVEYNYSDDFEDYSLGEAPSEWNQTQVTDCGASSCEDGYMEVQDDFSTSGSKSLQCLERTNGTRRCFLEAGIQVKSSLSFDYNFSVDAGSRFASISIFTNNGTNYTREDVLRRQVGSSTSSSTIEGDFETDLDEYVGENILIAMEVSGEGDGEGRSTASIDDFNLSDGGASQAPFDLQQSIKDKDGRGPHLMGRKINSTYEYQVEETYYPVDTAHVIDGSGSMSNNLSDVREASKAYIDSSNTSKGDRNAIVEFNASEYYNFALCGGTCSEGPAAAILENLTTSKSNASEALDLIEAGGDTNIAAGISNGTKALSRGDNPIQAMIVLADGISNEGVTKAAADEARSKDIAVHGIMFGSNPDIEEFEDITNSTCDDADENEDGDRCWNASSGNIKEVYNQISKQLQIERSADLYMKLPDYAYVDNKYYDYTEDSGSYTNYVKENIDISEGNHSESLIWSPTDYGEDEVLAPEESSKIEYTRGDKTFKLNFTGGIERKIRYVDFDLENISFVREGSQIDLNFSVENEGNGISDSNNVSIRDESGNTLENDLDLDPLAPKTVQRFNVSLDESNPLVNEQELVNLTVDKWGRWNSRPDGGGSILEPNEANNKEVLGYPPEIEDFSPNSVGWNESYNLRMNVSHFNTSKVSGRYNFTWNGTLNASDLSMDETSYTNSLGLQTNYNRSNISKIYLNYSLIAEDDWGAQTKKQKSYFVPYPSPTSKVINPTDNGVVSDVSPVNLEAEVFDVTGDKLNVSFYSGRTGDLIHNESGVDSGDTVSDTWTPADTTRTNYEWIVNVTSNGSSSEDSYYFRKGTGRLARAQLGLDLNYSSLVLNEGSNRFADITVSNKVRQEKNITLTLDGVDAEFMDGSTEKNLYEFEPQSSQTFTVRVTPESVTDEDLIVRATNNDLGLVTEKKLPVTVLSNTAEASSVPGIGFIQLIFLMLAATVLYSVRL